MITPAGTTPGRQGEDRQGEDQWRRRVGSGDWDAITAEVNEYGGALLPRLLTAGESAGIRSLYENDRYFRSTVNMAQPGDGQRPRSGTACPRSGQASGSHSPSSSTTPHEQFSP